MADLGPLQVTVGARVAVHDPGTVSFVRSLFTVIATVRPVPATMPTLPQDAWVTMPDTPLWWEPQLPGAPGREYAVYSVRGYVRQLANQQEVPIKNARVRLYLRSTGVMVGSATTAEDGSYEFQRLMYDSSAYYAVALDPDGEPLQNSLILDRLTPVLT